MSLEETLNQIFEEAITQTEMQEVEVADSKKVVPFEINLNGDGCGYYETNVTGLAFKIYKTIHAVINSPEGRFDIHVRSSAGTDESFNVRTGDSVTCKIAIKGKTKIMLDVRANVRNVTLKGNISY